MKKLCALCVLLFIGGGCASHHLPRDSFILGTSNASTALGHAEINGAILTGKAATPENVKAAIEAMPKK